MYAWCCEFQHVALTVCVIFTFRSTYVRLVEVSIWARLFTLVTNAQRLSSLVHPAPQ